MSLASQYFDRLLATPPAPPPDDVAILDPRMGRIHGKEELARFASDSHSWLTNQKARVETVSVIRSDAREVAEFVLNVHLPSGPYPLPVAVVAGPVGANPAEITLYHSAWPISGEHLMRAPIHAADPALVLPGVVAKYQRALAAGDLEGVLATFEPDATVREPSGGPHVHQGPDRLRDYYTRLFSNGGGIAIEHCTVTDDGTSLALEYNVTRWGRTELSPQPGLAVYVRGKSGKLAAARIYNDVAPPAR